VAAAAGLKRCTTRYDRFARWRCTPSHSRRTLRDLNGRKGRRAGRLPFWLIWCLGVVDGYNAHLSPVTVRDCAAEKASAKAFGRLIVERPKSRPLVFSVSRRVAAQQRCIRNIDHNLIFERDVKKGQRTKCSLILEQRLWFRYHEVACHVPLWLAAFRCGLLRSIVACCVPLWLVGPLWWLDAIPGTVARASSSSHTLIVPLECRDAESKLYAVADGRKRAKLTDCGVRCTGTGDVSTEHTQCSLLPSNGAELPRGDNGLV
jgi:hypothetical protein